MARTSIAAVQAAVVKFVSNRLDEVGTVSFSEIRDHVTAAFPGAAFNWLTAVRAPMQSLINAGNMKRTADVSAEVYVKL